MIGLNLLFLEMSLGLLKIHNVDCVVSNIDIFVEKGNEEKMIVNYFKRAKKEL